MKCIAALLLFALAANTALDGAPWNRPDLNPGPSTSPDKSEEAPIPDEQEEEDTTPKPDLSPGVHAEQACIDSKYTYDLFIPKAYVEDKEARFPAVFVSGSGTKRRKQYFSRLQDWAEKENVLIVSLNDSRNGLESEEYPKIQRAVVESVKKQCRLHPYLRFSIGGSGGGAASLGLSLQYPKSWAGIVVLIHSGNGLIAPKDCAVSFVAGEKDTTHGIDAVWRAYHKTKAQGNPVRITVLPDHGHKPPPQDIYKKELSWMLGLMKLAHPKLTRAERKALIPAVKKRIADIATIEDPDEKAVEIESLRHVSWIKSSRAYSTLVNQWFDIRFEKIQTMEPKTKQWLALKDLQEHEDASNFETKRRGKLSSAIRDLERDDDVALEQSAQKKLESIIRRDNLYRKRKKLGYKNTMRVQKEYKRLLEKYPNTLAAKEAQYRLDMLPKWIVR